MKWLTSYLSGSADKKRCCLAVPYPAQFLLLATWLMCVATVFAATAIPPTRVDDFLGRPRVIVISDIGNEPDDQMSLVRLLLYSNQVDLEALIASTSTWQKEAVHPETMQTLVQAYGQVRPNLQKHATGWPTAEALQARIFAGQPAYGMAAAGIGKDSPGSDAILRAIERDDPRPLWICVWGGSNTLAQALIKLRSQRSSEVIDKLVARLRVSSISDQDDSGPWLRHEFPKLFYVVEPSDQLGDESYYATWTGISGDMYYRNGAGADSSSVTNEWLDQNIRSKGPLGKVYPKFLYIMEGDTPSYLNLLDNGLNSYRRPDWGGWGGRYVYRQPHGETHPIWTQGGDLFRRVTSQDTVVGIDGKEYTSDQATIWRWRTAFENDFAARMDWTIKDFAHANHSPLAVVNGILGTAPIYIDAEVGKEISLNARGSSDPDGQLLHFHWFHYAEAGSANDNLAAIELAGADFDKAVVKITAACRPEWLPTAPCNRDGVAHIILAVTDDGTPQLTSYRRIILNVHQPAGQ